MLSPTLEQPLVKHRGSSVITAVPADQFSLVGLIDFPQPAIGRQQFSLTLTPELFVARSPRPAPSGFVSRWSSCVLPG